MDEVLRNNFAGPQESAGGMRAGFSFAMVGLLNENVSWG